MRIMAGIPLMLKRGGAGITVYYVCVRIEWDFAQLLISGKYSILIELGDICRGMRIGEIWCLIFRMQRVCVNQSGEHIYC